MTQVDLSSMFPRCERAVGEIHSSDKNEVVVFTFVDKVPVAAVTISIDHMANSLEKLRAAQAKMA